MFRSLEAIDALLDEVNNFLKLSFDQLIELYPTHSERGTADFAFDRPITGISIVEKNTYDEFTFEFIFFKSSYKNEHHFYIVHKKSGQILKTFYYNIIEEKIQLIYKELQKTQSAEECFFLIGSNIDKGNISIVLPPPPSSKKAGESKDSVVFDKKQYEKYVGILKVKDIDEYLGVATLVQTDVIITARHIVNEWSVGDLSFELFDGRSSTISGVIEDGSRTDSSRSENKADYLVLKLAIAFDFEVYPKLALLNDSDKFSLINRNQDGKIIYSHGIFDTGGYAPVSAFSCIFSAPGYSGSPYVDSRGNIFGIHIKASYTGIFAQDRTGVLFDSLLPGPMRRLAGGIESYDERKDTTEDNYFPFFSTALLVLGQTDESKPLRVTFKEGPPGRFSFEAKDRPENQRYKKVQDRIELRLRRLRDTEHKQLTDVQTRFLARADYELKANNIDIAHNIAISEMRDVLVLKMNTNLPAAKDAKENKAVEDFADAIASSDEDGEDNTKINTRTVRRKLPALVREIRVKQRQAGGMTRNDAKNLTESTRKILIILNRCSRNLMPGHSNVNSSIQDARDPHVTKVGAEYKETTISTSLARTANSFLGKTYEPKTRAYGRGRQIQSSSVDSGNDKDNAYYTPAR